MNEIKMFYLMDVVTKTFNGRMVKLTKAEAQTFNYAFALNGSNQRYCLIFPNE